MQVTAYSASLFALLIGLSQTFGSASPAPAVPPPQADTLPRMQVFRGVAPPGARVSLDSAVTIADTGGHWQLRLPARVKLTALINTSARPDSVAPDTTRGVKAPTAASPQDSTRAAVDSTAGKSGEITLCLEQGGQKACRPLRPGPFDTLELAPLHFTSSQAPDSQAAEALRPVEDTVTRTLPSVKAKLLDHGKVTGDRLVTVHGRRKPKILGQDHVTAQQIKRLPGLAEPDVIRAVQALPGVVASSDFSTKMYVRGSPSDENLVLYDNAVVYSPAHFGGLFSTFLADATGGLDFYKGGFDPYWGNRLASVLSVHSKDGGSTFDSTSRLFGTKLGDSAKVTGSARLTTFSGTVESDGKYGDWAWTLAVRRTWVDQALEAANRLNLINFTLSYFFYDWQGDVAWAHAGDTVRVSAYQGRDELDLTPLILNWGNVALPLNYRFKITDNWAYAGTFAWSGFDQTFSLSDVLRFDNSIQTMNMRQGLIYSGFPGHSISTGYEYNYFWIDFLQGNKARNQYLEDKYSLDLHAAYLQDKWVLNPRHTVSYGLRVYNYPALQKPQSNSTADVVREGLGDLTWDPRITYTYRPAKDWRYDAHVGYYHQYLTSLRFTDQETPNEFWYGVKGDMKPTTSLLTGAGVQRENLTALGLTASWEGYYKDIRNIPLFYPNQTAAQLDSLQSQGGGLSSLFSSLDGYAMGTELDLKREEGAISGELSYAYSQAVLRHAAFDNGVITEPKKIYYADWNQTHAIKLTANVNWRGPGGEALWVHPKPGRYFRSNFQWTVHTGLPYTGLGLYTEPHESLRNFQNNTPIRVLDDDRNDLNRPYYTRLDITPFDVGRQGHWRFYWTIINVFNSQNVYLVQVDRGQNPPQKTSIYQFPRLPIFLGYEYEF